MKIAYHALNFTMQTYKGSVTIIPFKIVYQTGDRGIEKYCKETYPDLIREKDYSESDLLKLLEMRKEIAKQWAVRKKDKENVHKYFYSKGWFSPFKFNDKLTTISFTKFDCKMWTDKEMPYLELWGYIALDIKHLYNYYIKKGLFLFNLKSSFLHKEITVRLKQPLCLALLYRHSDTAVKEFFKCFERDLKIKNSIMNKKMIALTKLKDFAEFKKDVEILNNQEYLVTTHDALKMLGQKLWKHKFLLGAAYLAYRRKKYNDRKKLAIDLLNNPAIKKILYKDMMRERVANPIMQMNQFQQQLKRRTGR